MASLAASLRRVRLMTPALLAVLGSAGAAAPAFATEAPLHPETVNIPLHGGGAFGTDIYMVTLVYKPEGTGPFPLLVFSHGRAGDLATRRRLRDPVSSGQVRYWLRHGVAVIAPIRPGYGATGGPDHENGGASFSPDGRCVSNPDYHSVATAAAATVAATLDWLGHQAWADTRRVVLEGQSVGGLTAVAAGAAQSPGVLGFINFAGGAGGDPERAPGHSCAPRQLTAVYGELGRRVTVPNVWIYAQNDQYWGPDAPKAWFAAFAAGGSATRFISAPPVDDGNGHGLSRHATALWAPYLDEFLAQSGLLAVIEQPAAPTP